MYEDEMSTHLEELLAIYRSNLQHLLVQAASYGGESKVPTFIANDLNENRQQIRRLKADLRATGLTVEDLFGEELLAEDTEATRQFSQSVREYMATLNRQVDLLTQEQFDTIQRVTYRRVRISGCAGSGKTLVAAEKAIRLAKAGINTLFLCHNPLLAEHVSHLTSGSGVHVVSFYRWVSRLAKISADFSLEHWSNYEEPDEKALAAAFDVLVERGPRFDAVIVDEAQDFRDEWWVIVEAALAHPDASILYIFHDDHQALLPYRANYPESDIVFDLSKNCRNAGNIFKLMNYFHLTPHSLEPQLLDQGKVLIKSYALDSEKEEIENVVRKIFKEGYSESCALLLGGTHSLETTSLIDATLWIPSKQKWQKAIQDIFTHWIYRQDVRGVTFPYEDEGWLKDYFNRLSSDSTPNPDDITLVCHMARQFGVSQDIRRKLKYNSQFRSELKWVLIKNELQLRSYRSMAAVPWVAEIILHFEREDWAESLPPPEIITLIPYYEESEGHSIRMYNVADFKGLEADIIILLMRGMVPHIEQELYVGISRARYFLVFLVDRSVASVIPSGWLRKDSH